MNERKLIPLGVYRKQFNEMLGLKLPCKMIYRTDGFLSHVRKKHAHCLRYLDRIEDIISDPDYVGCNPKEPDSIEMVKRMGENVLLAVKLDKKDGYLYAASMYNITDSKLEHRVFGGRLKKVVDKSKKKEYNINSERVRMFE